LSATLASAAGVSLTLVFGAAWSLAWAAARTEVAIESTTSTNARMGNSLNLNCKKMLLF
jgi:hypothetical protein